MLRINAPDSYAHAKAYWQAVKAPAVVYSAASGQATKIGQVGIYNGLGWVVWPLSDVSLPALTQIVSDFPAAQRVDNVLYDAGWAHRGL